MDKYRIECIGDGFAEFVYQMEQHGCTSEDFVVVLRADGSGWLTYIETPEDIVQDCTWNEPDAMADAIGNALCLGVD